jgi:hypothetical protein
MLSESRLTSLNVLNLREGIRYILVDRADKITTLPTFIAFRRGMREVEEMKGDKLSKENIEIWVKKMAQHGSRDRK